MKRIFAMIFIFVIILNFASCDASNPTNSNDPSKKIEIITDEDKYNDAISYIKSKDYDQAIDLLKEIPDYEDSKALLGKVHYIYGSELFNDRIFLEAQSHFQSASGYDDVKKRKSMADYYGGIQLANSGDHVSALSCFKRAIDSDYVTEAIEHTTALTRKLLNGNWIGTVNYKGNSFQLEMGYSDSLNRFSLIWADRSNGGYKMVTNMDYGTLSVVGSQALFSYQGSCFTVKFDFYSSTKVNVTWSNTSMNEMAGTTVEKKYAPVIEYDIPAIIYPTLTIPNLFSTITGDAEENDPIDSDSSSSSNSQVDSSTDASSSSSSNSDDSSSIITEDDAQKNSSDPIDFSSSKNDTFNNSSEQDHVHNFSIKATCEEPAKCECGETKGNPLEHKWRDATCEDSNICEVCGEESYYPLDHDWEEATCETAKTCKRCGKKEGSHLGHYWAEATCEEAKTCQQCRKKDGEALGHEYDSGNTLVCGRCEGFHPDTESILNAAEIKMEVLGDKNISLNSAEISDYRYYGDDYYTITILLNADVGDPTAPTIHAEAYDQSGNLIDTDDSRSRPFTQSEYYVSFDIPTKYIPAKFIIQI